MTQRTASDERLCAACSDPGSIESVHHVLLHCPAYARHRAALRLKIAHLPGAEGTPPMLPDEDGIVAFLREDFLGGATEAASAADAVLHAIATFRKIFVWSAGGALTDSSDGCRVPDALK